MPPAPRPTTPTNPSARTLGTPRRRKYPSRRLQGIKNRSRGPGTQHTIAGITEHLRTRFRLPYEPDDWQLHTIQRVLHGYDSIFCAGTGYGKSLVFQALASLGGKGKLVMVISPLKALERDQVDEAQAKGIEAIAINEDNSSTKGIWGRVRTSAEMVYLSPEMALSTSFQKLWKDVKFRHRLTAIVVDEAHCIDEWGGDDFRPLYRKLSTLRQYSGQDVPFVSCTATCQTSTFQMIWDTLDYGCRPFWGVDVGCDRPNLLFITRVLQNPNEPILDILNLLPSTLSTETKLEEIDKGIVYIDSEASCRRTVQTLRKCLPAHLRSCVQAFSSDLSEAAKQQCWARFGKGDIRILIATDAAGMGCNVADVKFTVILGCPKSFSAVAQRWGRAGRDRITLGTCLLLVPHWAFRPTAPLSVPAVQKAKGKSKGAAESKQNVVKRANLEERLEQFINIGTGDCAHAFLRTTFRPHTGLTIQTSLTDEVPVSSDEHLGGSPYEMTWTVLDQNRQPPPERCCHICNPNLLSQSNASDRHDERLFTFSQEFLFPPVQPPARPVSSASTASQMSDTDSFRPVKRRFNLPTDQRNRLRTLLEDWRERRHRERGAGDFFSSHVALPPKQLNTIIDTCQRFLQFKEVSQSVVLSIVRWDSATDQDLDEICTLIQDWRAGINIPRTPQSQRRPTKKSRVESNTVPVVSMTPRPRPRPRPILPQPNFGTPTADRALHSGDVFGQQVSVNSSSTQAHGSPSRYAHSRVPIRHSGLSVQSSVCRSTPETPTASPLVGQSPDIGTIDCPSRSVVATPRPLAISNRQFTPLTMSSSPYYRPHTITPTVPTSFSNNSRYYRQR